jgi:hypothetical protein
MTEMPKICGTCINKPGYGRWSCCYACLNPNTWHRDNYESVADKKRKELELEKEYELD